MTSSINIDSLKSSLIEKTEKYSALILVLAKKETENRLLPSSITRKNTVCEDLVKIISEETSEFEKLYSSINEKIAKRNFLAQQIAEQESIETPHSVQVLINQLDNEILFDKIYCDALHQSILVQTSTYDALIESAILESTEYDNLDPVISLLKDKTELLAIELASETEEYAALSGETNVLNDEKNTTVTVNQDQNTYSINTTERNNEQDFQESSVPTKPNNDEEAISTISAEQITEPDSTKNESGEDENNSDEANTEFDANDINSENYSLDPVELTNKLYASTIDSPKSNTLEVESDQNDTVTVDSKQFDFAIDVIKLKNEQDSTSLDSLETNPPEEESKLDHQNVEDEHEQINSSDHNELATDINVDIENSHNSVTVNTEQYDFEIEQVGLTNEQSSTSFESSELERSEDNVKFEHQNFEDEPEQLNNFSDGELSIDIDVDTTISPDSVTDDTNQHDVGTDPIELTDEQDSSSSAPSEIERPEDDELEQVKNFSYDELPTDIDVDTTISPDSATDDTNQHDVGTDPIELTDEQDSTSSAPSEIERSEDDELEQVKNFSDDELPTDIDVDTTISPDSVTDDTNQHDVGTDPIELTNEQDSTSSAPSEIERSEDKNKFDFQNFENELEQLENSSDDDLSTDINGVTDNSHDSVTVDTEQHDFEINPVELQHEQVSTSETEIPEDEFKLNHQDFQDELEQIKNFSHDELQSEIVANEDHNETTATIDTDQDIFSIDSTNLVNEQDSSDLKAAIASAELDAIENKFTSKSDFEEELSLNNRTTTRYVRSDIKTKLIVYKLLGASKPFDVELLDISSKGALIKSSKKLRKNTRVTLKFNFQLDARRFAIAGKIVRKTSESDYGIKFSKYQDEFADHLLDTQTHLVFK